jgi:hypothetical protein
MNVYVAGPMRGHKDFNFPAFNAATTRLRALGHVVFNPAERDVAKHGDVFHVAEGDETKVKGFSLREALGADMAWITSKADAIALLPGWEQSKGATAEAYLGFALGIRVAAIETYFEPAQIN